MRNDLYENQNCIKMLEIFLKFSQTYLTCFDDDYECDYGNGKLNLKIFSIFP